MQKLLPPLCLLLALLMLFAAFGVMAVEPPEAGVKLHRARVVGNEDYETALEATLRKRQIARKVLIGCLFLGSGVLTVAAFSSMRPPSG